MLISSQVKKALSALLQTSSLLLTQKFYLLGIVTTAAVLHLSLVGLHPVHAQEVSFYALGWVGIILLFWRGQYDASGGCSSCLGLVLLFLVIVRPLKLWNLDLTLFWTGPIVAGVGLGLLFIGFPRSQRQWLSFCVLCLMLFPLYLLNFIFAKLLHFSHVTTAISAFLLHYIGIKATYHDVLLTLPQGQVSVNYPCTGGPLIVWLLKLSLIIVIVFPLTKLQKLGLALCACGTGFLIGCIRVGLLAIVVNDHSAFDYWHGTQGGQIFLAAAILTFVVLCNWILPLEEFLPNEQHEQSRGTPTIIKQKWRLPSLATTWIGMVFAAIYLVCVPTAGRQLLPANALPDRLSLNGWHTTEATSLAATRRDAPIASGSGLVQFGKQYRLHKNNQQLEVQMHYVVNTKGEPISSVKSTKTRVKDIQKKIVELDGIGYYELKNDGNIAYLTACINPRGGSTVTRDQFNQNRSNYDFTWSRVVPWVLGKEILKDNRCVWVQISTRLNEANDESAYRLLESVWAANYTAWQSQFPPLASAIRIF